MASLFGWIGKRAVHPKFRPTVEQSTDVDRQLEAYRKANARAQAAQLVADEQLIAAVRHMYQLGYDVEYIIQRTARSRASVLVALVRVDGRRLEERRHQARQEGEYAAAHNDAWSHYPLNFRNIDRNQHHRTCCVFHMVRDSAETAHMMFSKEDQSRQ